MIGGGCDYKRASFMFFLILLFIISISGFALAETWVSDDPSDDAWIESQDPDDVNGGGVVLWVKDDTVGNDTRKSFVRFDLEPVLGNLSNATVKSATLRLFMHNPPADDTRHIIRRVEEEWDEGNITWNNQPNVALVMTDSQSINKTTDDVWLEYDVTPDVALFAAGFYDNFGWLVENAFEAGGGLAGYRSKDHPNNSLHPQLIIEYNFEEPDNDIINVLDLIELLLHFGEECEGENCTFDYNNNSMIDETDLNVLIALFGLKELPLNSPDLNDDGVVNVLDLIELLLHFGESCEEEDCPIDIYPDGMVNEIDVKVLLALFGTVFEGVDDGNGDDGNDEGDGDGGGRRSGKGGSSRRGPHIVIEPLSEGLSCEENWICLSWGDCVNGQEKRTCVDRNNCGTFFSQPELIRECVSVEVKRGESGGIFPNIFVILLIFLFLELIVGIFLVGTLFRGRTFY